MEFLDGFTKFHLGCGQVLIPGYQNIDLFDGLQPDRLYQNFRDVEGAHLLNCDLRKGLPCPDNSLDVIYNCHFLEHLPYDSGVDLLRQAHARLKPGGVLRIVVPDLELWIENYQRNNVSFFEAYRRQILGGNRAVYRTKASIFMAMLTGFGHQWAYDFETLALLLREVGFTNVYRTLFQESCLPEIRLIEPYTPLRGMESLCVECVK